MYGKSTAPLAVHTFILGKVTDARTGSALQSVEIEYTVNGGSRYGYTGSDGKYNMEVNPGNADVVFRKFPYFQSGYSVNVRRGSKTTINAQLSDVLPSGWYLCELTWEDDKDLDSHLTSSYFHIYFDMKAVGRNSSALIAWLDVDDTDGYGPEIIRFQAENNETYHYYIHNYSGYGTFNEAKATVKVQKGGVSGTYRKFVAPTGDGLYWHVFDVENGVFQSVNQIVSYEPDLIQEK